MSTAELKLKLFREIDNLEKTKLEEVYGLLLNFINAEKISNEWDTMPQAKQQGLLDAIEELNSNDGLAHQSVLDKYKTRYA
ncbi:hypothetical protein IWX83_001280 [Flavobacterium sp. CG_9.1]|uniref:Addiction module component n=2 Tax=Flavobacterium TaxID=237 RepID=A0A1M7H9Y0_9FLAO|nr:MULTISPECIES: hypothetical protein [Flavobacterium]MBG6061497.1 hypothetical protein [Flavobacterium sp. CG_9.1]OAB28989.1 hypothetical protein FBFR_05930 [Flavobacterium fryxellicola]SHM25255.1 hypothetical protein SAMN05443669_102716 [Flavobacterium xanthum]SHN59450.1 hypothetical protein SAMN05444395_102262 [Flavobacterium fryxellicola]